MKTIYQLLYQLKATQHNIREHWGSLLLSLAALGFTMLLFAAYLLLLANLQSLSSRMSDQLQIIVYLEKGISKKSRYYFSPPQRSPISRAIVSFITSDPLVTGI